MFVFNGDPMCVVHVFLNALDMKEKGYDIKVIIEGAATKLIENEFAPLTAMYKKVKDAGLFDCVCKACAAKMKTLEAAEKMNLPICGDMKGHPSMSKYLDEGYQVISF